MEPPIIITGGSVTVQFDESQLKKQPDGKFYNANKKIRTVTITGDYNPQTGAVGDGAVTVTISYENNPKP